ncbi:uncharacterized protein STEHIDRAFT_114355 [Stereum hirsutum FP-91666 SS1]|uniref:uncharacterized protein n=1 Tax=Stereum hirsutum (strain FP-91666) TaxID=721885 RepID=UPI0004449A7A|nr:uncharacterized protein STEHIDRAFT_114355 [Stereum hirsutum FP-91666 SS1]EIM82443.1 hypothetical protein STEHIDRAFT_114355 [Stereum hirsutum FP-91666 SS1]
MSPIPLEMSSPSHRANHIAGVLCDERVDAYMPESSNAWYCGTCSTVSATPEGALSTAEEPISNPTQRRQEASSEGYDDAGCNLAETHHRLLAILPLWSWFQSNPHASQVRWCPESSTFPVFAFVKFYAASQSIIELVSSGGNGSSEGSLTRLRWIDGEKLWIERKIFLPRFIPFGGLNLPLASSLPPFLDVVQLRSRFRGNAHSDLDGRSVLGRTVPTAPPISTYGTEIDVPDAIGVMTKLEDGSFGGGSSHLNQGTTLQRLATTGDLMPDSDHAKQTKTKHG